ncbi:hypothetical protein T440DRAFT_6572 [Plenodomus tracheiphilus IPT5]|uniref:Helix-turn-helix domain-containing protein n=1 Tax=Plenodomus tracheiphilus IPT5 TaxID=1408161 RepID=A0A6A7BMN2_9PLEO|nr:hypothetical protein T440DRAFT_6572 [Plenodomus tracheiphilus IPT5]
MGASASKTAKAAGGAAARKYPTRPPTNTTTKAAPVSSAPSTAQQPQTQTQTNTTTNPSIRTNIQTSRVQNTSPPSSPNTNPTTESFDPALAARLNTIGPVQPNPHYSPTSTSQFDPRRNTAPSLPPDTMMQSLPQSAFPDPRNNPVLRVLEARQRIAEEAEEEIRNVGRRGFEGRVYVDAGVIQLALMRRGRGEPEGRIEEGLGIRRGRLGVVRGEMLGPVVE